MQLLVATRNKHKLKEIAAILEELKLDLRSAVDIPGLADIVEDAATVRDNAIKKAVETAKFAKMLTIADDTGLEVDALNSEPGVRSARYAGDDASYFENNKKLLANLQGVPAEKRTARFRCVIAIADEKGGGGFGYDPLFIADGQVKTFAEISPDVKNRISHRGKALQKAWAVLSRYLRENAS